MLFQSYIYSLFVETWSNGDHLNIPGHVLVSSIYRKKHKNARRHSGGFQFMSNQIYTKGCIL